MVKILLTNLVLKHIIVVVSKILGNCVTVARQTLTLFVGVRIPIPQPTKRELLVDKSSLFVYPSRRLGISSAKGCIPCGLMRYNGYAVDFFTIL